MRTWITAQKLKFSIKNFFNKCNQIHSFLRIWCPLLEKSLMENFSFWAVNYAAFRKVNFFFNKIFYRKLNEIISLVEIASFSFPRKIFLKRKWTITTLLEELGDQTKFEWFCSEIMFLLLYYVGRGVTGLKIGFEPASIFDTSQLRCNAIRSSNNISIIF